ncbi:uncharacterized protein LOC119498278 isoform X1 [Sebastes umbrosus]|uniref:uncharacterized protein LOC119498278 isoform X1 n=1 Tax=Sebastes umbrosus TaxID=72105 RepID=UPI00189C69C2|nr:uncharacterized protein LOC119498278 isoform X1 [Sebastes umbrosus]
MESPSSTVRRRAWINSSRQWPTLEELDPEGPLGNLPSASIVDDDVFSDDALDYFTAAVPIIGTSKKDEHLHVLLINLDDADNTEHFELWFGLKRRPQVCETRGHCRLTTCYSTAKTYRCIQNRYVCLLSQHHYFIIRYNIVLLFFKAVCPMSYLFSYFRDGDNHLGPPSPAVPYHCHSTPFSSPSGTSLLSCSESSVTEESQPSSQIKSWSESFEVPWNAMPVDLRSDISDGRRPSPTSRRQMYPNSFADQLHNGQVLGNGYASLLIQVKNRIET